MNRSSKQKFLPEQCFEYIVIRNKIESFQCQKIFETNLLSETSNSSSIFAEAEKSSSSSDQLTCGGAYGDGPLTQEPTARSKSWIIVS
jgi:hypothetical protein